MLKRIMPFRLGEQGWSVQGDIERNRTRDNGIYRAANGRV